MTSTHSLAAEAGHNILNKQIELVRGAPNPEKSRLRYFSQQRDRSTPIAGRIRSAVRGKPNLLSLPVISAQLYYDHIHKMRFLTPSS
jgi:hypothetical protein